MLVCFFHVCKIKEQQFVSIRPVRGKKEAAYQYAVSLRTGKNMSNERFVITLF
jgi:uncharacterized iron-regulated protein